MSKIPDGLRAELRADYARAGVALTDEEIDAMAWEEACREAAHADDEGDEDAGWDDDHVWAMGPGPGYDDQAGDTRKGGTR